MRRRTLSWGCLALALVGCWSEEPRVDGFTAEQWTELRDQYKLREPRAACPGTGPGDVGWCDVGAGLGQRLFFEPALSANGQVACVTCHDPRKWYVDPRGTAVSLGTTNPTKHNTISVVNEIYRETFTWTGQCKDRTCTSPEYVILDIALPKAMGSSSDRVATTILTNPEYSYLYKSAFGVPQDNVTLVARVAAALHAYMRSLVSIDAPFDAYIEGNTDALSAPARRGFELFVGKAMCAECHGGPMFTDNKVHVTGVAQRGALAPPVDLGVDDRGGFFTPPLRDVENTGPYMHDGSLATLSDVIAFYRRGGDATGYVGDKDPLIVPLDLTDDEAKDLDAFLRSLTGPRIPDALIADVRSSGACPTGTMVCGASCVDTTRDPLNCYACGISCGPAQACVNSSCVPETGCPASQQSCGSGCVDVMVDPLSCGACGNVCPMNKPNCSAGACGH